MGSNQKAIKMSTSVVHQKADKFKQIIQSENFRAEIAQALPAHIRPERFQRVLLTSVINDVRLLEVTPIKVVKAALKVAPLGLLTDPLLGEAALVVDGKQDVQVRVMYRGLLKLAKQSNEVALAYAHDVCEKDEVTVALGTSKELIHKPSIVDRGKVVAFYAVVKYRGGEADFEIMTKDEIDRIRDKSDGYKAYKNHKIKSTPWADHYDEMAKKTVLRRLLKRVPASPDLADALRIEEEADAKEYGGRQPHAPAPPVDAESEYIEAIDQFGEQFMLPPDVVAAWARERAGECSDEELIELLANNDALPEVGAAVDAERANRMGQSEMAEPAKKQLMKVVDLTGLAVVTSSSTNLLLSGYRDLKAKAEDKAGLAVLNLDLLRYLAGFASGQTLAGLQGEIAAAEAIGGQDDGQTNLV